MRAPKPPILAEIPIDRHAVIEASAGTGKTYTLEHLVVELLLSTDVELESILVVTYTERAAGELRVRLRAKLKSLLAGGGSAEGPSWIIDEAARAKLVRSLTAFDLASISTIHAYCQRVLMENAFASHRLFEQQLIDGRVAFSRAFMTVLRRSIARDPNTREYLDAWLGRETLDGLSDLLWDCHHKRGRFEPAWSEEAFAAAVKVLAELPLPPALFALQLERLRFPGNTKGAILRRWQELAELLDQYGSRPPHLLARLSAEEKRSGGFLEFLFGKLSEKTGVMDPRVKQAIDGIRALRDSAAPFASATVETFLPLVQSELARDKAHTGQLDFDDMLQLLWNALEGPEGEALARSMRARHRYALVDEFQDTDDVQWKIFERVFAPRADARGNVLYVIGDPKQAIYGFRGADVHTYLAATQRIADLGGSKVSLVENHRSSAPLIEALNFILDQRADPPFFDGDIRYDKPVIASRAPLPTDLPGAPVHILQVTSGDGTPFGAAAARAVLGQKIAEEITELLAIGVDPNAIFVLARTAKECTEVGNHLRGAQIPLAFYKQEGLFQTQEAKDIRDLLEAIADPKRQSRRFHAWIGPFFAVPLESLPACIDLAGTHPLMKHLFEWQVLADSKDYNRLFTRILEDSGIVERELFFEDSERELTNYLHIFELLLEETSRARPTLEELIHTLAAFIDMRRLPEGENGNVQRLESERAAVQIMTMHKAKGLEARVVFLFGGFDAGKSSRVHVYHEGHERRIAVGRGSSPAIERERNEEDQRLLYVALTRAKERVYLPYFAPTRERRRELKSLEGLYKHLNNALDRAVALISRPREGEDLTPPPLAALFAKEVLIAGEVEPARVSRASRDAVSRWAPPERLLAASGADPLATELAQLRAERAGFHITSYSGIKAARGGYHPPVAPSIDEDDIALDTGLRGEGDAAPPLRPSTDLPGGSASGKFLHEVLEKISFETISDSGELDFWAQRNDVKEVFFEALATWDRDPKYLRHSQELVWTALTSPMKLGRAQLPRGVAGAKNIVREMEFLYPIAHPTFIKGFIDLVFEHEDRIYLLDWKSDLLASYEDDELEVHSRQNYALQAELYALALVKMLGISTREMYEARFGGTVYCFVRGMSPEKIGRGVLFSRPSWSDIRESSERLSKREWLALSGSPAEERGGGEERGGDGR